MDGTGVINLNKMGSVGTWTNADTHQTHRHATEIVRKWGRGEKERERGEKERGRDIERLGTIVTEGWRWMKERESGREIIERVRGRKRE